MQFKTGQIVQWTSQAGGNELTKKGTIIAVCRERGISLTKKTAVNILRETNEGMTIAKAQDKARYATAPNVLERKYRLKFDPWYGWREGVHYLVEVDRGEGLKPHLYHPRTEALAAV